MTEERFKKGEWTTCMCGVCEILEDDDVYCIVATKDVEKIINLLNENERLKQFISKECPMSEANNLIKEIMEEN